MLSRKVGMRYPRGVYWTIAQVEAIVEEMFSSYLYRSSGIAMLLAFEDKIPVGTTCNMKWTDVDLSGDLVKVTCPTIKPATRLLTPVTSRLLKEHYEDFHSFEYVLNHKGRYNGWAKLKLKTFYMVLYRTAKKLEFETLPPFSSLVEGAIDEIKKEN